MIKKTNEAKDKAEISEEKENIDVSIISTIGKKQNGLLEASDVTDFENKLRENYKNKYIKVTVLENSEPYIFDVTYTESGRKYYVTEDGEIDEKIIKRLLIEYKKTDGTIISKKRKKYTKETVLIETLELSNEIKEQNRYEFSSAEIEKADGTKVQVGLKDEIILEESIEKVIIVYNQKEIIKPKYTLTINAGNGTIAGSTVQQGEAGTNITIPTPTPPTGYTVTFNANGGSVTPTSHKTSYSFKGWSLTGGGTLSGNRYTFGNQNGTVTASYNYNGNIILPEPTNNGYIFKGWYTSITGGTKVGDSGTSYNVSGNQILYARWEPVLTPGTNIFFEPDITTWTNKDVTVKVRTTEQNYQIQLTTENPQIESNWTTTNTVTFKENGIVYARLTNSDLNSECASYNVNNIDKVAPKKIQKDMAVIMADSVSPNDTIHLQLNNIGDTESGVAKIVCYYRTEEQNSYMKYNAYSIVPVNGSKKGKTDASWSSDCKVKSSTFADYMKVKKVYLYAEVYDVAGNISKSWIASIDSDRKTTSYTESE